jgi:hypothetical protein
LELYRMSQRRTEIAGYVIVQVGNIVTVNNEETGYESKFIGDQRGSADAEYERACQIGRNVFAARAETSAKLFEEVLEFEIDLGNLLNEIREQRGLTEPGEEKSKLRAVGSRLEDALRELRAASRIVRGEKPEHDGRGPG